ncbi:PHP-associated domain-containing protein [Halocatena salina]|uniref:PHP domain-containing protein n=1 Tax=Halocatena salina TaxID=2934340 RepID=A0A8U0A016_9EURY|nr:PHP-associated domain-containing protein [Halocatena salina]UPM42451.1 PHP domain-containing protein [Halocatena salina]
MGREVGEGVRIDMHVKVLDESIVERAKVRGLDAIVYAPHFTRLPAIQAKAEAFSDEELTVFPAREIFTGAWHDRKHVLAVGLTESVPDFITLSGVMAELHRQEAAVLAPHPEFLTVSLDVTDIRQYDVHAVETYNPKHLTIHNERAQTIASETGLPGFASSYAHLPGTIGETWTTFEEPIDDVDDLAAALKDHAPRRTFHRSGFEHDVRCGIEFAHLLYENTWSKIDRTLLSGTEPTHPGHIAYEDRFEDVRVY